MRRIDSVTEEKEERKAMTEKEGTGWTTDGRESGVTSSTFDETETDRDWNANDRRFH